MQITSFSDYALRTLIHIGLKQGERATISEIAQAYDISRNHLMKIVTRLAATGYVESIRGKHGGLLLKQAPEDMTIGQILRDMEPDMALVECFRSDCQCRIQPACRLTHMLDEALAAFMRVLDGYTLADALAPRTELANLLNLRIPMVAL